MNVKLLHPEKRSVRIDVCSLMEQNMARADRGERPLHRCSVCGECAEWSPAWSWYGSHLDEDAGTVAKFCSPECRAKEPVEAVLRRVRKGT